MMDQTIRGTKRSWISTLLLAVAIPVCLGIGFVGQFGSLMMLREVRMLERLPVTPLDAAIPGPIRAVGTARPLQDSDQKTTFKSRWTDTPSLWVRSTEEVKKKDSDGNSHWDTVSDRTDFVDFDLQDSSGMMLIIPDQGISSYINESWQNRKGDRRYTEYRIVPGDQIRVVGLVGDRDGRTAITFNESGEYIPILANRPIRSIRSSIGFTSTLLIVLSVLGISGSCVAFMLLFRLQNTLAFVLVVGIMETSILLVGGYIMLSRDLQASHQSALDSEQAARKIIKSDFEKLGISWDGKWLDDAAFDQASKAAAPGPRIALIRENLGARFHRTEEIRNRFPQWVVAGTAGVPSLPNIVDGSARTEKSTIQTARPFWMMPFIGLIAGLVLGFIGLRIGMNRVKLKRLIENIPNTPCDEVEIGITELVGRVKDLDEEDATRLTGPLTDKDCVWFDYHVQEWRGTGKNRHLHTIERRKKHTQFCCEDDSGHIPVNLDGAKIISGRSAVKKSGNRVYTEKSLREGDPLYILGSGEIDESTGDSLMIRKDPDGLPYLVSNLPESRIKTRQITAGFWLLAIGMSALTSVMLFVTSFAGTASAMAQLLAAMGSIILVVLVVLIILYNDLVFLRQRVLTSRSNIDVALKKRLDLLPSLESVAKGYAKHESDTQKLIAELRTSIEVADDGKNDDGTASNQALRKLLATRESYPDLKANTVFENLMRNITSLENEIAARRQGFNATVERYRSRIHTLPEAIIAKTFGFHDIAFLKWEAKMIAFEDFDLAPTPTEQKESSPPASEGNRPSSPPPSESA
ncbi:MAG: hypothetical protein CMJ67_09460 [Planctomycetaceae bacterium]|nr:hypothetical protein [Planctomycetaceae bacterium]